MRPAQGSLLNSWAGCKPCSRFVMWSKASWERGRPARTMTGTASAIPSAWINPAAPWLSFGQAVAVTAGVVAACKAARKLSDHHKEQYAGGTPALPGAITPPWRGSRRSRAARRRLMRWGVDARLPRGRHQSPLLFPLQGLQQRLHVALDLDLAVGLGDVAFFIYHEGGADDAHVLPPVHGLLLPDSVGLGDGVISVAEQ